MLKIVQTRCICNFFTYQIITSQPDSQVILIPSIIKSCRLKHFITEIVICAVIGSGGTRKEAKNDAARKLLLEMKKATREGRTLISGVPKEEFVACCEW
jgi:hypothetical protein